MVSEQMTNVKPDFPSFSQQPNSPEKMQNSSSSSARVMLSTNLQAISPKLIKGNYRFWRSQVLFAVGAHELEDHLTGLDPCPSPFSRVILNSLDMDKLTYKCPFPEMSPFLKMIHSLRKERERRQLSMF